MKATSTRSPRNGVRISGIRTSRPRRACGRRPSGNPASRASGVPLVPFRQPGLLEPRPFPPRRFRGKQGKRGGDLIVRHGRNGGFVEHKKIPSDRWEASWGKGYRQTTRPGPPPNRLLLFGGKIIHHLLVYLDFWYSRLFYLIKLIEK